MFLLISFVNVLLYSTVISILLEPIPDGDSLSFICLWNLKEGYQAIVPYYLQSCYTVPHATHLKDLIQEQQIHFNHRTDLHIDVIHQNGKSIPLEQSPAYFALSCDHPIQLIDSTVLLLLPIHCIGIDSKSYGESTSRESFCGYNSLHII